MRERNLYSKQERQTPPESEKEKEDMLRLLGTGGIEEVLNKKEAFQTLSDYDIVTEMMKKGVYSILKHLDTLKVDQIAIAESLISVDAYEMFENVVFFESSTHKKIIESIIALNDYYVVDGLLHHIDNFEVSHTEISLMLFDAKYEDAVIEHISKMRNLSITVAREVAKKYGLEEVAKHITSFAAGDHGLIFKEAFANIEYISSLVEHIHKFKGIDYNNFAKKLLLRGDEWAVAEYLSNFKNLNREVFDILLEEKEIVAIAKNINSFDRSIRREIGAHEPMEYAIQEYGIDGNRISGERQDTLEKIRDFTLETSKTYRTVMRLLMMLYQKENQNFTDEIVSKIKERGYDTPQFSIYDTREGGQFVREHCDSGKRLADHSFLLNFNLPRPFGRFWYRGGYGDLSIPVDEGNIEWGDFYRKSILAIWDAVDQAEEDDLFDRYDRINEFSQHDYKHYYYLWEVKGS